MSDLRGLPHIAARLASELSTSGIETSEQLMRAGSLGAASCLASHGFSVCRSKLFALEGGLRNIRWHSISAEERTARWETFREQADRADT
ncbi:TfoX/Sxy family DNA transformation protein [Candidatus Bipolaricaulota bacterium]|nr:TfoX/Sxy family DNA transformation protein [Candidatus Bipolaricaulota bacterium]TFH11313.1 MAG: competence protein TfoX [Candidatus Atribacteria bacterium]